MGKILISTEGTVKVWRDDKNGFPSYSTTISKRGDDNKYINMYKSLQFMRGVELQNGQDIVINNAFPTFRIGKDGKKYEYWMVTDFDTEGGAKTDADGFMQIDPNAPEEVDWD